MARSEGGWRKGSEERVVGPGANHEEHGRLYSGILSFFLRAIGHMKGVKGREGITVFSFKNHYSSLV